MSGFVYVVEIYSRKGNNEPSNTTTSSSATKRS
uniref:Uncharacterized protein n=1 Tax=Anguilla anguilla TaxID=7936 RepID=A0A0E9XWS0_ANGAN